VLAGGVIGAILLLSRAQTPSAKLQILQGGMVTHSIDIKGHRLIIGRAPDCAVQLLDPAVSAYHASIERTPQGYVLSDLGSQNGTYVNGQSIQQVLLQNGDVIRLGNTEMRFLYPRMEYIERSRTDTRETTAAYLVAGDKWYPLTFSGALIGRDPYCDIVLNDPMVSRQHARIDYQQGQWFITDLGSKNGTYVNGYPVEQQMLNPGDEILLGNTTLVFSR